MKFKYYYQRNSSTTIKGTGHKVPVNYNYKKQTSMLDDDTVSECEIHLTKDTCGPVSKT
jgi:hypothetical protein